MLGELFVNTVALIRTVPVSLLTLGCLLQQLLLEGFFVLLLLNLHRFQGFLQVVYFLIFLAKQLLVVLKLQIQLIYLSLDLIESISVSFNFLVKLDIKSFLLLNFCIQCNRYLSFLVYISLSQFNCVFNSLCVLVAVQQGLVTAEQNFELLNHSLYHFNSIANRALEFEDQMIKLLSQLLLLLLVQFFLQLAFDLLFSCRKF